MAWKSYALGSVSSDNALPVVAEILNEIFDSCVADTTKQNITLTYNGVSYVVPSTYNYSTYAYERTLFVNDETGAFLMSRTRTMNPIGQRGVYEYMSCALLEIQTEENKTELVPIPAASYEKGYYEVFAIPYASGTSSSNSTTFVSLTPVVTQSLYNTSVENSLYRPVVGLFASNVNNIAVGMIIEVAGQRFICVAVGLFAKL